MMDPDKVTHDGEVRSSTSVVWMRGLFMLLLLLAFALAQSLLWVIAIAQFCWLLFAGEHNAPIARFGRSLALWLAETARYITCASEMRPFPWAPWPAAD